MRYMNEFYLQLEQQGVIPVVVLEHAADALSLADALAAGGLQSAEVTFRTKAAPNAIRAISQDRPDMLVGAGTVLNVAQAQQAVEAGARFIVSPGFNPVVVDWCVSQRIPVVPGAVTPTEITALISRGLHVSKFFPAHLYGGLNAIETLAGVFVGHRFMPTGGVSLANLADYLRSPAIICCVATWICRPTPEGRFDFAAVSAQAAEASAIVRSVRAEMS